MKRTFDDKTEFEYFGAVRVVCGMLGMLLLGVMRDKQRN